MYNIRNCCLILMVVTMIGALYLNPIRTIATGQIQGTIKDVVEDGKVEVYLGVPFAKPPVSDLRFEMPVPIDPWTGVRSAAKLMPMCIQQGKAYVQYHAPTYTESSEDCLYLNVFVPVTKKTRQKFAVLVYIHGGSNIAGASMMLDSGILAAHGNIIVVTVAYRLGMFGFFGVLGTSMPGNYAFYDMILGLHWVHTNIGVFGGDKDRVTLMGHSAGASDVGVLAVSPLAKDLFNAVICQSGSVTSNKASRSNRTMEQVLTITSLLGCKYDSMRDIKDCLKTKDASMITSISSDSFYEGPIIDDVVQYSNVMYPDKLLPSDPISLLKSGFINGKHFLISVTSDEAAKWIIRGIDWESEMEHIENMVLIAGLSALPTEIFQQEYRNWDDPDSISEREKSFSRMLGDASIDIPSITLADILFDSDKIVYFAQFAHMSRRVHNRRPGTGVPHGEDLFYLFGVPLEGHLLKRFDEADKKMSRLMIKMWSNFVKHRNPAPNKTFDDDYRYDKVKPVYIRLSTVDQSPQITIRTNFKNRGKHFWNKYIPYLINRSRVCIKEPVNTANTNTATFWLVVLLKLFGHMTCNV